MPKSYLTRKEKIIINAIDILDQGGINGLTMKEIANQQGITEPAVYRQFKNKQEIVLTILGRFSAFDKALENAIYQHAYAPDQAIVYLMESHITYYQNYPQVITVLFSFDVYRYDPEALALMEMIMKQRHHLMTKLVMQGVDQGLFNSEQEPSDYAEMLLGQMESTMYRWKLDDCRKDVKQILMKRVHWMLKKMK
ncbi:TetR/AcrR family transcriptional regulator [Anoxynatronum sibiricum]|uniref:TetR/AcrR family transcriptional regulator n=1 Tax=Anoxynatronum sibiricum TaxID=210623 RepID=A0ABU9VXK6_9CLOT